MHARGLQPDIRPIWDWILIHTCVRNAMLGKSEARLFQFIHARGLQRTLQTVRKALSLFQFMHARGLQHRRCCFGNLHGNILIHACVRIATNGFVHLVRHQLILIHVCARVATWKFSRFFVVAAILIHACVRIVTLYAGIMSKEEVILIHACARIVAGSG